MGERSEPLVTVVIPVYNHERYVLESVQSIIDQTYRNIELIIIDDGSRDNSHERVCGILDACRQRFVRCEYIHRENRGLSATLNQALAMAEGKYFSTLASDDVALPDKVSLLVEALESKGDRFAAAFGNALFIDDDGKQLYLQPDGQVSAAETATAYGNYLDFRTNRGEILNYRGDRFGTFATLLEHNYLPAMSNLVRTGYIREVGGWTNGNASEDWELWRKLAKQYRFTYVDKPVALYRWHDSNSVKTITGNLRYWSFLLLRSEKQYCRSAGLVPTWRRAYCSLLLPALQDNTIPLTSRLSMLSIGELLPVSPRIARRLLAKLRRMARNRN